jgi:hypothetical protein
MLIVFLQWMLVYCDGFRRIPWVLRRAKRFPLMPMCGHLPVIFVDVDVLLSLRACQMKSVVNAILQGHISVAGIMD